MRNIFLILFLLGAIFSGAPLPAQPSSTNSQQSNNTTLTIYFFWGEGCPHCARAKPFLDQLKEKYPQINIQAYEIKHHPENKALAKKMAAEHGFLPTVVPTIFIGNDYFEGFNQETAQKIEASVKKHLTSKISQKR